MEALVVLGSMISAAAVLAAIRQKASARRKKGPIQLGVGAKIRA